MTFFHYLLSHKNVCFFQNFKQLEKTLISLLMLRKLNMSLMTKPLAILLPKKLEKLQ